MRSCSGKFFNMGRKWNSKLISLGKRSSRGSSTSVFGDQKGKFVIYTSDQTRFVIPIEFLWHGMFQELLKKSEEKYGNSVKGPITLPCDAVFMEHAIFLIQRDMAKGFHTKLYS